MDDFIAKNKLSGFASYAEKHELFDLFKQLTRQLTVHRPEDPIPFLIEQLQVKQVPEIFIVGTPACDKSEVCKKLAETLHITHVQTKALLTRHIAKKSSFGLQVKSFVERGELVPDSLMFQIVMEELEEFNLRKTGYVLEGFPRTVEQAFSLQRRGIVPTHLFYLNVPSAVAVEYNENLMTDPLTNTVYNMKTNPPEQIDVVARLVQRNTNSKRAVLSRVNQFEAEISKVVQQYGKAMRVIHCDKGITGQIPEIVQALVGIVEQRPLSFGDKQFRIFLAGVPGSGKSSVAKLLCDKYGLVHVSPKSIILEAIDAKRPEADQLKGYVTEPEFAPDDILSRLIVEKLQSPAAVEYGYVLDGWPLTEAQIEILQNNNITPTRVILLQVAPETALDRLRHRKYNKETMKCIYLPDSQDDKNYISRPEDNLALLENRTQAYAQVTGLLERVYGTRNNVSGSKVESGGLVISVRTEGVGEGDGLGVTNCFSREYRLVQNQDRSLPKFETSVRQNEGRKLAPSLLKTFELVENAALRPVKSTISN